MKQNLLFVLYYMILSPSAAKQECFIVATIITMLIPAIVSQ